jgi:hypothetical protein
VQFGEKFSQLDFLFDRGLCAGEGERELEHVFHGLRQFVDVRIHPLDYHLVGIFR